MASAIVTSKLQTTRKARNYGIVSSLVLLVTICGYLRDAMLAAHFGISPAMDAYVAAFFIPNLLYLVLITGALSPVFVPLFLEYRNKDLNEGFRVFSIVANFSALGLVSLVGLASLTARWWLRVLFSGFSEQQLALSLQLYYVIAPALVLLGLAGILAALLNALDHFVLPAISPITYSVVVMLVLTFANGNKAIYAVAVATAIGLSAQLFIQIPAAVKLGVRYSFAFDYRHPALRQLLRLGGPLVLYLLVAYGSVLIERNLASRVSTGAVSGFNYATRLFSIPFNLLAAPLALVSLPEFSKEALKSDRGHLAVKVSSSIRLTVFMFLPITVWMFIHALPVTRVMLEHGGFNFADSRLTASVLAFYSLGILPNAAAVILLRGLYAIQDTLTPLWVESVNCFFYIVAAPYLAMRHGLEGLAVARAISFFIVACMLFVVLNHKLGNLTRMLHERSFIWKVMGASFIVGAASLGGISLLQSLFDSHGFLVRTLIVGGVSAFSMTLYLSLCALWSVPEPGSVAGIITALLTRCRWASRINIGEDAV